MFCRKLFKPIYGTREKFLSPDTWMREDAEPSYEVEMGTPVIGFELCRTVPVGCFSRSSLAMNYETLLTARNLSNEYRQSPDLFKRFRDAMRATTPGLWSKARQ